MLQVFFMEAPVNDDAREIRRQDLAGAEMQRPSGCDQRRRKGAWHGTASLRRSASHPDTAAVQKIPDPRQGQGTERPEIGRLIRVKPRAVKNGC